MDQMMKTQKEYWKEQGSR